MSNSSLYDVIIVGGGVSGLKAAETLVSSGFANILLLEAQDRLGGRINTIYLDGNKTLPLELGANWLHGIDGNPLNYLVKSHPNVFYHDKEISQSKNTIACFDHNGNQYDSHLCENVDRWFEEQLEEIRISYKNGVQFGLQRFEDYIKKKFEIFIQNETHELKKIKRVMLEKSLYLQCIQWGCDPLSECSLDEFGSYEEFSGGNHEFPGGYSKLINFLATNIPSNRIKLNTPVDSISRNGQNLNVNCKNGNIYNTKHVIVTCSLGFLKQHYNTFFNDNLLDLRKIEAINKMSFGLYFKLFVIYDDASFLPSDVDSFHFIPSDDQTNFNERNKWLFKIVEFKKVYNNVYRTRLVGNTAPHVESLSDEEISYEITELLKRMLKNKNVPLPKRLIRSNWCLDPYIGGCYSYIPHGSSLDHLKQLSEPIYFDNIPKILFAGEATHYKYYSTVLAAYLTGEQEAKRCLEFLNIESLN